MQELIGPIDLISIAWSNFKRHYKAYIEFTVWFVALALFQWALTAVLKSLVADKTVLLALDMITSLPTTIVGAVISAAIIDFTARALQKRKVSVRESFYIGLHKLIPFLWVSFLFMMSVIFGLVLLVIPALVFLIWFKFASYHLIVDDTRGSGALAASKQLVSGRWWAVLWRVVIPFAFFAMTASFLLAVIYLIIGAVLGDPSMFFGAISNVDQLSNTHTLIMTAVPEIIDGIGISMLLSADIALWMDMRKKSA